MKALALSAGIGTTLAATAASGLTFTGKGAQIYICQNTLHGYAWKLKGPDAKLYDASGQIVGRHFFGPLHLLPGGTYLRRSRGKRRKSFCASGAGLIGSA
jgi:Protein of unknown function (DUF3455)